MKYVLSFLLLMINAIGYAQISKTFTSANAAGMDTLVDIVLKGAVNKYRLTTIDTIHENAVEIVYSSGNHKLIFEFLHIKNAEKGYSIYTFISVTGIYKDLFPFWKKYYQPGAKAKNILKTSHANTIMKPFLDQVIIASFNNYGDNWEIENRYPAKKL